MKRSRIFGVGAVLVALAVISVYLSWGGHAPQGQPPVVQMDRQALTELRTVFNDGAKGLRVIVLMSPT